MLKRWIPDFRPGSEIRCRVFCFPHAGGSAALYHPLRALSPVWMDVLPVELPGRSGRFLEAPFSRVEPLIGALQEVLSPALDRPFAFFGHSMGASIAFAAGLRLRSVTGRTASHVFLSGRGPPNGKRTNLHRASDNALIAALAALGLTPPAVLARQDMMRALLPIIRADLALSETYAPAEGDVLACPLAVFAGKNDPVAPANEMAEWSARTSATYSIHTYPGGHFFLVASAPNIIGAMSRAMRPFADGEQPH